MTAVKFARQNVWIRVLHRNNLARRMCMLVLFVNHCVSDGDHDGMAIPWPAVRTQPSHSRWADRLACVSVPTNLHNFRAYLRCVENRAIRWKKCLKISIRYLIMLHTSIWFTVSTFMNFILRICMKIFQTRNYPDAVNQTVSKWFNF